MYGRLKVVVLFQRSMEAVSVISGWFLVEVKLKDGCFVRIAMGTELKPPIDSSRVAARKKEILLLFVVAAAAVK